MIQITYQKRNGTIFQRIRNTYCPYRVGDTTSMGWKVLDIKHKYGNKYYSSIEYDKLIDKEWKRTKKLLQLKYSINNMLKYANYLVVFIVFTNAFQNYIK